MLDFKTLDFAGCNSITWRTGSLLCLLLSDTHSGYFTVYHLVFSL